MRLFLPLLFVLISCSSFCQDDFYVLTPKNQELYRGVDNYVTFVSNSSESEIQLTCPSCDTIYETEIPGKYLIRVGHARVTQLIVTTNSTPAKVLANIPFKNFHLPNPKLYFGASSNGTKCSKYQSRLSARYPAEINLNYGFEVVSWELFIGEEKFEGDGHTLTDDAIAELKKVDISIISTISFIAKVKGPDGLTRLTGAVFRL